MLRFAVIGNPVEHSLSPQIHHYFAEQLGIELIYSKIETTHFESACNGFFLEGGAGLNVTIPYKQQAFALDANHTARCNAAKAANTLWLDKNGKLHADNTDGVGIVRDLQKYTDISDKSILLIGAGGASRGIIPALKQQRPSRFSIVNRSAMKAIELANEFSIEARHVDDDLNGYDLLINSTSASLDFVLPSVNIDYLDEGAIAYDCVYHREPTVFMLWAQKLGAKTCVDGLGMLVEQAAESFSVWLGSMPAPELRKNILQKLRVGL